METASETRVKTCRDQQAAVWIHEQELDQHTCKHSETAGRCVIDEADGSHQRSALSLLLVSTLMDRLSCSESGEPGGVEVCAGSLSRSTSITAEQLLLPMLSSPKKSFCIILKLLFLTCGSSTLCTISFVKRITGNVGLF